MYCKKQFSIRNSHLSPSIPAEIKPLTHTPISNINREFSKLNKLLSFSSFISYIWKVRRKLLASKFSKFYNSPPSIYVKRCWLSYTGGWLIKIGDRTGYGFILFRDAGRDAGEDAAGIDKKIFWFITCLVSCNKLLQLMLEYQLLNFKL